MTNKQLHETVTGIDTKVDDLTTAVTRLTTIAENRASHEARIRDMELGIAKRSGTFGVMAKVAIYVGGAATSVVVAFIIAALK